MVADQYRELREFYERQIREAAPRRDAFARNPPEAQRKLLRELTGAIDQPRPPVPRARRWAKPTNTPLPRLLASAAPGDRRRRRAAPRELWCGATEFCSSRNPPRKRPAVIAVSDATGSAADLAGLTGRLPEAQQTARQLALAGLRRFRAVLYSAPGFFRAMARRPSVAHASRVSDRPAHRRRGTDPDRLDPRFPRHSALRSTRTGSPSPAMARAA